MKLAKTILATGLVVVGASSYLLGYLNGAEDIANELHPRLTELRADREYNKTQLKEVNKKLDDLKTIIDQKDLQLSKPVMISTTNISFESNTKVAKFTISAYSPYDDKNYINSDGDPSTTSTGATPGPGTFAVDPSVIPYGSKITIVYPDGTVEHGVAEDTGGAIKNNRIDVFRYTYKSAIDFGMKNAVVMWQ
jgi:3D (Asp-Asp-Asp) domain-containing protein